MMQAERGDAEQPHPNIYLMYIGCVVSVCFN